MVNMGEKQYDFVEVMSCPGGCIGGAGQPVTNRDGKYNRGAGLYNADRMSNIKRSEENPIIKELYDGMLKGKVHKLLHVNYRKSDMY